MSYTPNFRRPRVQIGALTAAIGAGGSILGGILSSGQQSAMNRAALDAQYQQMYLNRYLAQQQLNMSQAATRDARGNVTEYVPGYGWITTPSDMTKRLIASEDRENLLRNTRDAVMGRVIRERTANARGDEAGTADTLLRRANADQGRTPGEVRSANIGADAAAVNDPARDIIRTVAANKVRSGGTGVAQSAAIKAAQDTQNRGVQSAIAEGYRNGPNKYYEEGTNRNAANLNPYNLMATRAQTPLDVAFQPQSLTDALDKAGQGARTAGVYGLGSTMGVGRGAEATIASLLSSRARDIGSGYATALGGLQNILKGTNIDNWWDNITGKGRSGGSSGWGGWTDADSRNLIM